MTSFDRPLRRISVVGLDESAELLFATDGAVGLRSETFVEYFVVHPDTAVGSLGIVVGDPNPKDVVELAATKADEVIETFSLESPDERFNEGIGLG